MLEWCKFYCYLFDVLVLIIVDGIDEATVHRRAPFHLLVPVMESDKGIAPALECRINEEAGKQAG